MSKRAALVPIVLALVFGAAGKGALSSSPPRQTAADPGAPAKASASASSTPATAPRIYPGGIVLLRDFLPQPAKAERKMGLPDSIPPTGVVIATLPDPTDSHLDWAFDSDFEAILRAYERTGYVIDRFWLPWLEKYDTLVADDTASVKRRLREMYPGVVVFRRELLGRDTASARADAPPIQVLYIVGEVPTAGVHKGALRRALAERDTILAHAQLGPQPVRLVGPSFSGSARSIRTVLEERLRAGAADSVVIVTGSSTSRENAALLDALPHTSYRATVHSDSALTIAMAQRIICPLKLDDDEVAVLRESGTAYGAGAAGEKAWLSIPCPNSNVRVNPSRFVVIPFPMNIGGLRSEFERSGTDHADDPTEARHSRARLSLRDPERPMDKPSAASALTATTLEVLLDEIESTITGHRIRAVGILASDVRDKIFLARELRRRLRDVQLFTFEGNALFLVPENNRELRGMLVVSSYPLPMHAQWWLPGPRGRMRLSFPNEGAIGIHNAVLHQLDADSNATGFALPLSTAAGPRRPPVWLSAVGRQSLIPIALDTIAEAAFIDSVAGPAWIERERLTMQFFTGITLILLSLALLYAIWNRLPRAEMLRAVAAKAPREERRDEVQWGSLRLHAAFYSTLRGLALLSAFIPVAVLTYLTQFGRNVHVGRNAGGRYVVVVGLLLAGVLGAAVTLSYAFRSLAWLNAVSPAGLKYLLAGWDRQERREKWEWRAESLFRAAVVAWGVFYFYCGLRFALQIFALRNDAVALELFVNRAIQLDSGISPVLPLILAAVGFAVWCTWHLHRIRLLCQTTPFECAWRGRQTGNGDASLAVLSKPTSLPDAAASPVHWIRSRLFLVVPDGPGFAVLAAVLGLGVVLAFQIRTSIDAMTGLGWFDMLLRASISGSVVATCWAVYRLLTVWRALERVLERMGQTPLLPAFGRLPERISHLTRLTLWSPPSREVVDTAAAAQWRELQHLYAAAESGFGDLDVKHSGIRDEVSGFMNTPPLESRFDRRLADGPRRNFGVLDGILSRLWAIEPDPDVLKEVRDELKKSPGKSLGALVRHSFPTDVRVWLRSAEEFAAVQVVDYIEWVLQQLRSLALFLFVSLLLTTALISSYPFQGQSVVRLVFMLVLLVTVGALLYVMSALNRDPLLSTIANTDPGRLNMDRTFIVNAVAVGVVPLVTLIGSQANELPLFGWIKPVLALIGGG